MPPSLRTASGSLSIRPIGSETGQQLAGTDNVNGVFWSPDSRQLAFVADRKLRIIALADGSSRPPRRCWCAERWNLESRRRHPDGACQRQHHREVLRFRWGHHAVNEAGRGPPGGSPRPARISPGRKSLPVRRVPAPTPEEAGIFLASLDPSEAPTRVVQLLPKPVQWNGPCAAPSHLMYLNNGTLTAHRLDSSGRPQGDPIVVAEDLDGSVHAPPTPDC